MNDKIQAKIICDSISEQGHRLTTMQCTMHRFVLAELNTHRAFSRNSASSRAIPVSKTLDQVYNNPALPLKWLAEQKGMQAGEELSMGQGLICEKAWNEARHSSMKAAKILLETGLHKSYANRLLEPFMWHTVVITATEWDNFFSQRSHSAAMPEMKEVADHMQRVYYENAKPKKLSHGQWHLPYITQEDWDEVYKATETGVGNQLLRVYHSLKAISTARCARVSYLSQEGTRELQKDYDLHDRLVEGNHWSPFEHVATPISIQDQELSGNFVGWKQYRKDFANNTVGKFVPNLPELAQVRMKIESGVDYLNRSEA